MPGKSILVVEDNPANLRLVRVVLLREGYEVLEASNATIALHVLSTFKPQLILMDMQLPGISGFELTTRLKSDPKYKDIYIVALTAYGMKEDEQKTIAAGCDCYLTKPIDLKTFPGIIARFFDKK